MRIEIRRKRGLRGLRLSVHAGGRIVVSAPLSSPRSRIKEFVESQAEWIKSAGGRLKTQNRGLLHQGGRKDFLEKRHRAMALACELISRLDPYREFKVAGISIRNQSSRWGSCSRAGRLNFNYRIIYLPARLREYLVMHELCHLKEFNHSRRFWAFVAAKLPDYAQRRKEFKRM